jgi:hypothetical protein
MKDTYSISVKKEEKQLTSKIISGQDDLIMSLLYKTSIKPLLFLFTFSLQVNTACYL